MGQYVRRFDQTARRYFVFKIDPDEPSMLHIWARHLCTPDEAILTWRDGSRVWNQTHKRWESYTASHGLFWFELKDGGIMVVSCFKMEGK